MPTENAITALDRLHKLAQAFGVPCAVLVPALGVAMTEPLKVLVAILGLMLAGMWTFCNYSEKELARKPYEKTLAFMPVIFVIAWLIALSVHTWYWFSGK